MDLFGTERQLPKSGSSPNLTIGNFVTSIQAHQLLTST